MRPVRGRRGSSYAKSKTSISRNLNLTDMRTLESRRFIRSVLMIVIIFTILAALRQQWALVRGVWIALLWQAASVAALAGCARCLSPPITRGRAWVLAGLLCVKFPLLYALGYVALRYLAPSAWGLAIGLTLPWAVLVASAGMQVAESCMRPAAVPHS